MPSVARIKFVGFVGLASCCLFATVGCTESDTRTVTVFAASSLQGAFRQLGTEFANSNPNYTVMFSFGSSTQLAHQIMDGAPADVFAAADTADMDLLAIEGEVTANSTVFATNRLRILVSRSAINRVLSLADLSRRDVVVVLASANVPLGRYSANVLAAAGVTVSPASYEPNASSVVSKVVSGEADAGIVYFSDIVGAGSTAVGVDIPMAINPEILYPIAVTRHGKGKLGSALWVNLVLSRHGQKVLREYDFSSITEK